jgi:hypothetical protein
MKSRSFLVMLLLTIVLFASCSSARKAKKCGCPTFGYHQNTSGFDSNNAIKYPETHSY